MADQDKLLDALDQAVERYEATDAARERAREALIAAALDALREGVEPGDVYDRVPFTGTHMRTLARDAGIPAGRPGIKPSMKSTPRGKLARGGLKPRPMPKGKGRPGQAAHGDDTPSST